MEKSLDFLNTPDDPTIEAVDFFKSKGWNDVQTAAIVGNLAHESAGLQPHIKEKGGSGYGLAQWTSQDRKKGLFEYAKSKGEGKPSFQTQLEYVQLELEGPESDAAEALSRATTLEDATKVFSYKYERPGKPLMGSRFAKASKVLNKGVERENRKAVDFLNEEEPSIFSVSEAHAEEIPKDQKPKMKAIDFLESDNDSVVSKEKLKAKQSAIDFLDAPDEPGMLSRAVGVTGGALSRSAGVVAGTANALSGFPFAMGGFKIANENPEEWAKLPFWEKALVATGSGIESSWDSIAKQGSFGADVSDFNKYAFGKTTEEALPDNLKWAAPTIDLIQSVAMDPTVSFGVASKALGQIGARKTFGEGAKELFDQLNKTGQVPVMAKGELPAGILDDIAKLDALDAQEKAGIRQQLIEALGKRKEHQAWREEILANPPIKHGDSSFPRVSGEEGEISKPTVTPPPRAADIPPTPQERAELDLSEADKEAAQIKTWQPEERPLAGLKARREEPEQVARLRKLIEERKVAKQQEGMVDPKQVEPPVSPEGKMAPEIITRADGTTVKQKDIDQSLVDQLKADLEARKAGTSTTQATTNPLKSESGAIRLPGMKRDDTWSALMKQNPNWKRINDQITEVERRAGRLPTPSQLNVKLLDRFAPIKKVSPETYEDARKHSSHKDVAAMEFSDLQNSLKEVKNDEKIFRDYVTAKRMETRALMLKESASKPTGVDGAQKVGKKWAWQIKNPGDVRLDEAQSAIKEMEDAYKLSGKDPSKLQQAAKAWNEWTRKTILEPMNEAGIISDEAYASILKDNDFYAAFDVIDKLPGDLTKIPGNLPSSEFFSAANQNIIKGLKGTEKKIADPIQSTIKKFLDAKALIARNKVASTLIDDIQTNPNSSLQGIARPVAETAKDFARLKKAGLNPIRSGAWPKKDFDTIARFKDGKVEKYIVPKELADSMKQLTPFQAPRWVHALNNVFRSSATSLYLPFTISNAMRDGLMAYSTAPVYKAGDIAGKFQKDWAKGLVEGFKHEFGGKSDLVKEYLKSGGGFGWVGEIRTAEIAKSQLFKKTTLQKGVSVITSPFKLIEKISSAVELAPRVGTYSRAKAMGETAEKSAMMARESTIDFAKGGTWTKVANQFLPFLNARVQGRVQVVKALQEDRNNFLAKTLTGTVLPGMAAYAWNRLNYSDLYDDIPEHIKQNYFTIITGTDKDKYGKTVPKYFVIAKGDLGQMAVNPLEYGIDKIWEKDREGTKKFLVNYLAQLSPIDFAREGEVSGSKIAGGVLPPIVKGAAEDIANLNTYTGREVIPGYMEKKPPEMQYKEWTPETYKWLGKKIGVSPLRIQNFAQNILAGYGREGLDPSAMIRGLGGRFQKTTGGAKEDKAWDVIEDMDQGYNYTRAYAQEMVKSGNRSEATRLMNVWNSGLNKRLHEIEEFGVKDKGGLRRDFMFTPEKMKNVLTAKPNDNRSPLDKRLAVK